MLQHLRRLRLSVKSTRPRYETVSGVRAQQVGRDREPRLHREHLRDERGETVVWTEYLVDS